MNKKLKTFLLALVLIPCAFVFCACGGDGGASTNGYKGQLNEKSEVDTSGTYEATTSSALSSYVADLPENAIESFESSYKATITMAYTHEGKPVSTAMNSIFKQAGGSFEAAMKIDSNMLTENGYTLVYIKDGYTYVENGDLKVKASVDDEEIKKFYSAFDTYNSLQKLYDIFRSSASLANVNVSVNGNIKKYRVDYSFFVEGVSENRMYFVFDNDKFVGVTYEIDSPQSSISITLSKYSGNIDFPSFSDFVEEPVDPQQKQ